MPTETSIHGCPIQACSRPENQETRRDGLRLLHLDALSAATDSAERALIEVQAGRHPAARGYLHAGWLGLQVARKVARSAVMETRP
jgi:hypothetical protein